MRNAFSTSLMAALKRDPLLVILTGDHGHILFQAIRQERPDQFINCGIAEQNMVSVAAGLAKSGFRPIVYALSAFLPTRVMEQIKLDICYEELPVILIGDGAGVVYSKLGCCHHSTEDIAALRALPHMHILSPGDPAEMTAALALAFGTQAPVYLRMGKSDLRAIHQTPPAVRWGHLVPVASGSGPLALIATGSMLGLAMELQQVFPDAAVWSAPVIKPLDPQSLLRAVEPNRVIVTLEEHNIMGGLGSSIAEMLSEYRPLPVCRLGIPDRFSRYCGSYQYLMREHRLDFASSLRRVGDFLSRHGLQSEARLVDKKVP
jgi:transketolase